MDGPGQSRYQSTNIRQETGVRHPEFEASLSEARLYPELWRFTLGTGFILFLWASVAALITVIAVGIVFAQSGPFGVMPFLSGVTAASTPASVIYLLLTFLGLFLGCFVAVAAFHGRGPMSLLGPWDEWLRGFLTALAVMAPIYGVLVGASFLIDAPAPNLAPDLWLKLLPLTLVLIFLQTSAEELFFRGYLQQQLAVRFQARWVWFWLPSITFCLLHWNPDAGGNLPLVLLSALTFGLIAADLTERTGSLGAAMGLHLGNNFIGIAIVSIADTITGLALYVTPLDISQTGPQSLSMAFSILLLLAIWGILSRVLDL